MDYKARFYSPKLGRFTQPDTIVAEPGSSQAWNRYSYVYNNPINLYDPSGHRVDDEGSYNPWKKTVRDEDGEVHKLPLKKDIDQPVVVIIACGVGDDGCKNKARDNQPHKDPSDNVAVVPGLDTPDGSTTYYVDYEASGEMKDNEAADIIDIIMDNPDALIYVIGHSAGADAVIIAIALYLEGAASPEDIERIGGVALLDPTFTVTRGETNGREEMKANYGLIVDKLGQEKVHGWKTDAGYFPVGSKYEKKNMTHMQLAKNPNVIDSISITFGW